MLQRSDRRERLDERIEDQRELAANLADLRVVNRWFGGAACVIEAVASMIGERRRCWRILDVATGSGDVPLALQHWAQQHGVCIRVFGSDLLAEVLAEARIHTQGRVPLLRHNALHLPFAPDGVDIITCSQTFHHFEPPDAAALLAAFATSGCDGFVVSDLRRSLLAYWGAKALAILQRSAMSRHDGPLSVLRAYTVVEAQRLCIEAGLPDAVVRPVGMFRLAIVWRRASHNRQ